jgi:PTH1 family peptidyl-tRNA hydrolase
MLTKFNRLQYTYMKIILAQGNPGIKYQKSRHNTGFFLLDRFAETTQGTWVEKKKFNAQILETSIAGEKILLVKPTTFYNDTGLSARKLIDFYTIDPATDFLVIHDDLALPIGTIRTRTQGSDAGNNGIKSLNQHIGQDYHRIRIGIWNALRDRMDDVEFVLGNFSAGDTDILSKLSPTLNSYIEQFVQGSLPHETFKLDLA